MAGFVALADPEGLVLAVPDAIGGVWDDGRFARTDRYGQADDVGYLTAADRRRDDHTPIDPQRVYVFGMSNGAAMAGRLACERADRITAIAQVAGTAARAIAVDGRPTSPVPILQIHGAADHLAPYEGGRRGGASLARSSWGGVPPGRASASTHGRSFWVAANRASAEPTVTRIPPDTTLRTWRGPTPRSDVVFYRIDGMGHTWPGSRPELPRFLFGRTSQTIDATRVIRDFLAAHAR